MTVTVEDLVRQIHSQPVQMVLATTGGGSQAIAELLKVPGASRTVLEATVPYAPQALDHFLKAQPESYCSERTARAMAMAAFCRAKELVEPGGSQLLGIGCTASLASDRPKRGPHRVHAAVQTKAFTETITIELAKGARSRAEEEMLVGQLLLNLIANAAEIPLRLPIWYEPNEPLISTRCTADEDWQQLMAGQLRIVAGNEAARASNRQVNNGADHGAIFPGAFHPLHEGHQEIAELAHRLLGTSVGFEISIDNVDKLPLDYTDMQTRAAQFSCEQPLWLTRAATFVEKAKLFPGATFLVGVDTILRIADPRYYHHDISACRAAIHELAHLGNRFLVFGRTVGEEFITLEQSNLPPELRSLCQAVPRSLFQKDVSSTELRRSERDKDLA